ncbi:MAG: Smr/MutS family protein [Methylocapsa sp.]|nr:Smr/MutS family protein [Methylocapsa sp.]
MNENPPSRAHARTRELSAAEVELWLEATRTVARKRAPHARSGAPQMRRHEEPAAKAAAKSCEKLQAKSLPARATPRAKQSLAPMDHRLRQKLARGRAAPEAEIDLHGMRREEAFLALKSFLLRAQDNGIRLVLVVTGKGNRPGPSEIASGVLRKYVPEWLRSAQYHAIVAGFEEAARLHGGTGALYVRLRRWKPLLPHAPRGTR